MRGDIIIIIIIIQPIPSGSCPRAVPSHLPRSQDCRWVGGYLAYATHGCQPSNQPWVVRSKRSMFVWAREFLPAVYLSCVSLHCWKVHKLLSFLHLLYYTVLLLLASNVHKWMVVGKDGMVWYGMAWSTTISSLGLTWYPPGPIFSCSSHLPSWYKFSYFSHLQLSSFSFHHHVHYPVIIIHSTFSHLHSFTFETYNFQLPLTFQPQLPPTKSSRCNSP